MSLSELRDVTLNLRLGTPASAQQFLMSAPPVPPPFVRPRCSPEKLSPSRRLNRDSE